ncbi:MAG: hypothetical protein U0800_18435 [Isosphaeraceae bacterium]
MGWTWLSAVVIGSALVIPARAQDDSALKDRVAQLVERLESPKIEARAAAEKALIELGAKALPLLPEGTKKEAGDRDERLARIRAALKEAQELSGLKGTTITLKAKGLRLSEVLKTLQSKSGSTISDLREQFGGDASNPTLDLSIEDRPFLAALDEVARKAGVSINYYTGDGSIGLMPSGNDRMAPSEDESLIRYEGPFRVELQQYTTVRAYNAKQANGSIRFEVAWEPNLRPMLLALKAEDVEITDDRGKKIEPQVEQESTSVVLRPENPVAELNLNMAAPDRASQKLAKVKVKADVTVPASIRTFRFPKLTAKRTKQTQGDVTVTLLNTEIDEQNWMVSVEIAYEGGGPAFESYQQGLFNNRVFLQKPDGSVFEQNGGFNQIGGGDGKIAYEYIFVDAPGKIGDYQLVFETPSKVVTIPLAFEFQDIPLP